MKVDDLLRRAAEEVREAGREARFTVRAPGSSRRRGAVVAFAAAAVTLAVGVPLLLLKGPWRSTVLVPTTTTSTMVAPTTTQAPGDTPVASVEELVTGILAALTAGDGEALRGLSLDRTWHHTYGVQGSVLAGGGSVDLDTYQPQGEAWEVLGEVMVAGKVAVTPVQATYAETLGQAGAWVGFDVIVVEEVAGGFLGGTGLTLFAQVAAPGYAEADPAEVAELLAAQAAAWAAGDIDAVLADYSEDAKSIDGSLSYSLDRTRLVDFYGWFRLAFTGEPVISGPFFAVATRVTDLESGVATNGVSVYWVREGEIALHVLATGS